jgi:hypothetical protein
MIRVEEVAGLADTIALPSFTPATFNLQRGTVTTSAYVPFSARMVWTLDSTGRLWSGVSDRYRLFVHTPGGDTLFAIERPAQSISVTPTERDEALQGLDWFTSQGGRIEYNRLPKYKPEFERIHIDDLDRLWIHVPSTAMRNTSAFDIFMPDGSYRGRIIVPIPIPAFSDVVIRRDALYAVSLVADGVPQVVRVRIIPPEGQTKVTDSPAPSTGSASTSGESRG